MPRRFLGKQIVSRWFPHREDDTPPVPRVGTLKDFPAVADMQSSGSGMTRKIRVPARGGVQRFARKAWLALVRHTSKQILLPGALGLAGLLAVSCLFLTKTPPRILVVGLSPRPPFMFWNANGEAAGAMPDLLSVAAARAGITLRWVSHREGPESALLPGSGIDIWPVIEVREERRTRFHMTQPFARAEMLMVRLASEAGRPIVRLGLKNRPGVLQWASREYPGAQTAVASPISGVSAVCKGALDATLMGTPDFDAILIDRPAACVGARFEVTVLSGFNTHYAIASSFPAADAADRLRQKLGEMAREGTLDQIFQHYYPLAHYRSSESFAETPTERSFRLFKWSAAGLFAICALLGISMRRFRRKADEAVAMADLRTRFLASISHELRTPLNGVLGIASALSSTTLDRTQREYVGLIRSSGEILLRTVNEVLDFSRLEAGKHALAPRSLHVEEVVEGVVSILAPVAQQKDLELAWVVEPDVPAFIESDESALRQILMNLVGNGLKFTECGIVTLRISQRTLGRDVTFLRILVSDSGPGIPIGQEDTIFNPFTRSDNARTQAVAGTGLGLTITKRLVLLLGGSISVASNQTGSVVDNQSGSVANNESGGCIFTVEIPITLPTEPVAEHPQCYPSYPLPPTALLLTRRAITGDMLARRLEEGGCRVMRATGFPSAMQAAQAGARWELLVIDHDIEGDSLDMARQLQRQQKGQAPKVILLTTGNQATVALSGSVPGGYAVFPKPFLSELFCSTLERLSGPLGSSMPPSTLGPYKPRSTTANTIPAPSVLLELQRAAQPLAALPPGCNANGKGCEACVRDNSGDLAPCVSAALPISGSFRVLVADDNPVNLKVITSLLRTLGIPCDAASNGEEALRLFSTGVYAWVVMDWQMPGMDGLTAIQLIRERELRDASPRTPIILCSAVNEEEGELAGSEGTFEVMLPKPISIRSLRRALIVSSHRARAFGAGPLPEPQTSDSPHSMA